MNFSYRPEWSIEEATPDYAKSKERSITPTALIYPQNRRGSSTNCACRSTVHYSGHAPRPMTAQSDRRFHAIVNAV
jgi:hypothetical protein